MCPLAFCHLNLPCLQSSVHRPSTKGPLPPLVLMPSMRVTPLGLAIILRAPLGPPQTHRMLQLCWVPLATPSGWQSWVLLAFVHVFPQLRSYWHHVESSKLATGGRSTPWKLASAMYQDSLYPQPVVNIYTSLSPPCCTLCPGLWSSTEVPFQQPCPFSCRAMSVPHFLCRVGQHDNTSIFSLGLHPCKMPPASNKTSTHTPTEQNSGPGACIFI